MYKLMNLLYNFKLQQYFVMKFVYVYEGLERMGYLRVIYDRHNGLFCTDPCGLLSVVGSHDASLHLVAGI